MPQETGLNTSNGESEGVATGEPFQCRVDTGDEREFPSGESPKASMHQADVLARNRSAETKKNKNSKKCYSKSYSSDEHDTTPSTDESTSDSESSDDSTNSSSSDDHEGRRRRKRKRKGEETPQAQSQKNQGRSQENCVEEFLLQDENID